MTHSTTTAIKPSRSNEKSMDWTSEWGRFPCPSREPLAPPHVSAAPYAAPLRYGAQEPAVACRQPQVEHRVASLWRGWDSGLGSYRPLPAVNRVAGLEHRKRASLGGL